MPWLAGTALLHSAIVVEKRDALKGWTVLLAILTFGLSLLGTFLVRSGVLTSVHAFATDPDRGVFILGLLVVVTGGALVLYALRAPGLKGGGLFAPVSREGALVLNNLLLATAAAVVLLGTLYPLILDALGGGKVSVGPPFFETTFVPIMAPLLIACVIGATLAWKRGDLSGVFGRLWIALVAAVAVIVLAAWRAGVGDLLAAFGLGLAAWLFFGALVEFAGKIGVGRLPPRDVLRRAANTPRSAWGMTVAHAGLGIVVAGVTASSAWQTERIQLVNPGDAVEVAGYTLVFRGAAETRGPNYRAVTGRFDLERDGRVLAVLRPEKRDYPAERSQTTEAAIHTTWLADIYAVLGERAASGAWTARLYHNPLVPWIWIGAIVMAAGGAVSLTDRRLRIGAPRRARRGPGGRSRRPAMIRPATLVPVAVFVLLAAVFGLYLHQIGTGEKNAAQVPSALIGKPAPEFDLPPIEGMDGRVQDRGSPGPGRDGQRVRLVVPALPAGASFPDAARAVRRAGLRNQHQGQAEGRARVPPTARQPVPPDRRRPVRPGFDRLGRVRLSGDLHRRSVGAHPVQACRPDPGPRSRNPDRAAPEGT